MNARGRTMAATTIVAAGATLASVEGLAELLAATAHMSVITAWAVGAVLDLAVVVLALQARDAVREGRSCRVELTLTWVASVASGLASGWHQGTTAGVAPAVVRVLLPLVAATLWHLTLVGDRAETDQRPARRDTRRSRLLLRVAQAETDAATPTTTRHGAWIARRQLRAARQAMTRHIAATSPDAQGRDLTWWRDTLTNLTDTTPPRQAASAVPARVEGVLTVLDGGRRGVADLRRAAVAQAMSGLPDGVAASEVKARLGQEWAAVSLRTIQRDLAELTG